MQSSGSSTATTTTQSRSPRSRTPGWAYRDRFFLILNVAVGGNFPGYSDWSTQFPQRMEVDHVRVFDWV